ncbi:MAG TPA: peptidyl-prolyl cis-trans isomerase [Ignavibacteriaceae bacterium]|nr:peptidyl-prolyl cis-trans isomerase [Ignavibacteriaceae bacterium]
MRIVLNLGILILLLSFQSRSQEKTDILVKIGNKEISRSEFQIRYELTPQLYRENRNIKESLKREFLYSLIAEKLLSLHANAINIDTSEVVQRSLKTFEEMFVRDALYKKVVRERAKDKADSLLTFYLNNANNVQMIFIHSGVEDDINNIYGLLKLGVPFDSLYIELKTQRNDTLTVSVGELDEEIEKKIFHLPDGAFTIPIELEDGWYIFKILNRYNPVLTKSKGWESDFKRMQRLALERAEYEFYEEYISNFFKNKKVNINAGLLKSLSQQFYLSLEKRVMPNQSVQSLFLMISDLPFIANNLGPDTLSLSFIELDNQSITLGDFLHFFRFENFKVDSLDLKVVFNTLSNKTRKYIEYKMLSDEGYKLGLHNSEEVKKQLQMWKDNYYMQLITSEFIDSARVNDDEILAFYNERKGGNLRNKEVNILQLVTDSLEVIESILNDLEAGKDFHELLLIYFDHPSVSNLSGESGFFSVAAHAEIGSIVASMEIGEIYGPVKLANGYSIFKLLDVKEDSVFLVNDFEQIRTDLGRELGYLKKQNSFNKFIANLATKYNVKINFDLLKSVIVTSHQSIIYNYLGFGGKVLAVPLLNVNMEWVPEWQGKPENIQ